MTPILQCQRRQTIQGPASRPVVRRASAKYSWRKNETLLGSGKTKLQAMSGKKTGPARGRTEAGARGGEQDPKEDRQHRRGTQGEAPRGGGGQAQPSQKPAQGRTTTRKPQPGGKRRAGEGRAGERARGRAGGRRGGPAAAGGEEAGRTGRPAGKRTAGRTGGRADGEAGDGQCHQGLRPREEGTISHTGENPTNPGE